MNVTYPSLPRSLGTFNCFLTQQLQHGLVPHYFIPYTSYSPLQQSSETFIAFLLFWISDFNIDQDDIVDETIVYNIIFDAHCQLLHLNDDVQQTSTIE